MTEIAQLFESALRQNRANLLRKAAINTVAKMPAQTTLHDGAIVDQVLSPVIARLYRQIIEACSHEPKTIGQLAKVVEVDVIELRGYLAWMKKMGKIDSSGRARATRYHLPHS